MVLLVRNLMCLSLGQKIHTLWHLFLVMQLW